MYTIIDGKKLAQKIRLELKTEAEVSSNIGRK